MTAREPTMVEQLRSTPQGRISASGAELAVRTVHLLGQAVHESGMTQAEIADALGVTAGRVSQVLNGDGNVRIATLARFLEATGYTAKITALPHEDGKPELPILRRRRRADQPSTASGTSYTMDLAVTVADAIGVDTVFTTVPAPCGPDRIMAVTFAPSAQTEPAYQAATPSEAHAHA